MAVTREDMEILDKHFDDRYDHRYRQIDDCNNSQADFEEKLSKQRTRIEIATHDLSAIKKGIWLVATASIGSLVTALFELLTR